jgi:hypothetical protein
MNNKKNLAIIDNNMPYIWLCYATKLNPMVVFTSVLAIEMIKEDESTILKKHGEMF